MARTVVVGEVRTGRRITQIPVVDAPWSMVHRGPGDIQAVVPLGAEEFRVHERRLIDGLYPGQGILPSPATYPVAAKPVWTPGDGLRPSLLAALEPVRCFLAVLEGDHVLESGPIWRWDYDNSSHRLTVTAKGWGSLFDYRYVLPADSGDYAAWAATYKNMGRGTIAKRLVQLTMSHQHGDLPINLPADEPGTRTRTYRGFDLATVRQRIDELSNSEDGPEIAFQSRLSDDRMGIVCDMRVGTEAAPLLHQRGEDWQWRVDLAGGPVVGVSMSREASEMTSEAFAADSAMEISKTIVRQRPSDARVPDAREYGFPLLQSAQTRQGDSEDGSIAPDTLRAWARADLAAHNRPHTEITLRVRADAHPRLGTYRPGDWTKVAPGDHPLLSLLWAQQPYHRARIAQISGGMGDVVDVALMPALEGR